MEEKVFIVSKEEFLIMAAVSGIRSMYGFEIAETGKETGELLVEMHRLVEKGFLDTDDEKFYLQEPMKSIFQQIKEVKTTMDVHKQSGKKCIIYISDFGVKVSFSAQRKGKLEIQAMEKENIWSFLQEEGWIPASV